MCKGKSARNWAMAGVMVWSCGIVWGAGVAEDPRILQRGDANNDQSVNQSDAVYINNWLYSGGPEPPCMNQADVNDDGIVSLADSTYLWNWLYKGGSAPPPPGPVNPLCNDDPTEPHLGCYEYMCN